MKKRIIKAILETVVFQNFVKHVVLYCDGQIGYIYGELAE